jgi:hypothetical protein
MEKEASWGGEFSALITGISVWGAPGEPGS